MDSDGRQVVTSEFGMPFSSGRNTTQSPLGEKSQAVKPNKATDSDPAWRCPVSPGIRQNNNRCARWNGGTEKMTDSRNPERQQAVSDFAPPATQDLDASPGKAVAAASNASGSLSQLSLRSPSRLGRSSRIARRAEAASAKEKRPAHTVSAPPRRGRAQSSYLTGLAQSTPVYTSP